MKKDENSTNVNMDQYKEIIINKLSHVEDLWILGQIHKFITSMTEEGD